MKEKRQTPTQGTVTSPLAAATDWKALEYQPTLIAVASKQENKGHLNFAVYSVNPCGCEITGNGTLPHPLAIEFCPLHKAAKKLLEQCERFIQLGKSGADTSWHSKDAQDVFYAMMTAMGEAKESKG